MNKRIITFNVGDYWHPNARASVEAAAQRWDLEVVEIDHQLGADHVFAAKFRTHIYARDARCMYLDGDIVIHEDAPSPFDLVPLGSWGAVRNFQGGMTDHDKYQRPSWERACFQIGEYPPYNVDHYVNGGLIMFDESHVDAMKILAERVIQVGGVTEQAAWGVMMTASPTVYLPHGFNRVGSHVWESPNMDEHVYHFACYKEYRQMHKADRIASINWRAA